MAAVFVLPYQIQYPQHEATLGVAQAAGWQSADPHDKAFVYRLSSRTAPLGPLRDVPGKVTGSFVGKI